MEKFETPSRGRRLARVMLAVCVLAGMLAGCIVNPKSMSQEERDRLGADSRAALFAGQEPLAGPMTLSEAMARAIKYQADYRQRQMEQAAAMAQLDVSRFDMLPRIMVNAGYSNRNNDSFGYGFTPAGQVALNPSASSERELTTGSIGFAWNLLDFGVSYFRARQLADQTLIGEERRRKALQTLVHDVRVAWWRAEAAQRLLPAADAMLAEIDRVSERTRVIEARRLLPPQQTATLRRALLDLAQQISLRRMELAQAKIELAALVSAPPGSDLKVAAPATTEREVLDFTGDVDQLEVLALRTRPEIAEEGYRTRITADEARKAIVGLLPGVSFDTASNYNSNKYLVNNTWNSVGVTVALNLVKLFSLPALNRSEEAQKEVDSARRLAMSMAVLAQMHLATVRYDLTADEFRIWDEAARDDDLIVGYITSSARVGIDTEIELIRAKARALVSHMNRDLAYSVMQASMARVFHSVGYDAVPREDEGKTVADLARQMQARLTELEGENFSRPATPHTTAVAISVVKSSSEHSAALLREGAKRVLELAKVRLVEPDAAEVRLEMDATLDKPEDGKRNARVDVRVLREGGDSTANFKTTMSEPVDDEQWRVLGEGAAYRVLDLFTSLRPWRPSSRPVDPAKKPVHTGEVAPALEYPYPQGEPLMLNLERSLRSIGRAQNLAGVVE